jgi:xylulokinase
MFLGIDIGTSGVKAIVIDDAGGVRDQASVPLTVSRLHPRWSEQDPDAWWSATTAAVCRLDARLRARVQAVGLAGQMHGATVLGPDDRPLRAAILWNDGRSFAECAELESAVPDVQRVTGNFAMPGFTAPKLAWLRKHEPACFAQIRSVLLPKDYVRLCMTGDKASDMSDSAGTLWLDVAARRWSSTLLKACGLTTDHMPQLYEGTAVTGTLRAAVAQSWGMAHVPVAAGGGDNAAGAAGVGVTRDGDALLSLGTSGVIFVATDGFRPNPGRAVHAFCHCLPDLWHQMSVHLSAAACIDWAAALTGSDGPAALFARAEASTAGPELFLPYLSGERTPHNDPHVRGAFLGLGHETDGGTIARAVLEGVAFALADGLDALRAAGTRVDLLSVIGGGARSAYWGRIIAAVLGVRLAYRDGGEVGPALGAAKLAQIAATGADAAHICVAPPISHSIEPDPVLAEQLAPKRARFAMAYPLVRQIQE